MSKSDCFLKLDGIDGDSKDGTFRDQILLESFSWGAQQPGTMAFGGAGKVVMNDFRFIMKSGKATTSLLHYCASGKHIPKAVLNCRKAGGKQEVYMTWTMTDLLVTSADFVGDESAGMREEYQLAFNQIAFDYKEQTNTGGMKSAARGGWNIKANQIV